MEASTILLILVYAICYPISIAAMEFAISGGGNKIFLRFFEVVFTVLAAASAAGLHAIGKL